MIVVDSKHWPLLLLRFERTISLADVEGCLQTFDKLGARNERYVSITDISTVQMPSGDVLRRYANWYRDHEALLRAYCLGSATMAPSTLVRGILKALNWIQPSPQPQVVVSTFQEGMRYVTGRLKEGGMELPATAVGLTHC